MAFQSRRFIGFLERFNRTRYHSHYLSSPTSFFPFPFSTLDDKPSPNHIKNEINPKERFVLDQLSELLPIPRNSSAPNPFRYSENPTKQVAEFRAVDGFLLPEEKLRGVFLQKLKGKTAIEQALTNVGIELSLDIVARVVNTGNLGGEAMVMFFNWAIKNLAITKDINGYRVIIKALGRRNFFKFMTEILRDMRTEGVSLDLETLSIVLDSFVRAHRVSKAIQMFGNVEEFGLKCNTECLNVLLQCMCHRSHVSAANSFLNSVKGKIPFDVMTYNIIIGGWSKLGRVSEIESVLKAMLVDGFSPDCSTFSYLIEGLGRAGRIDDAVEIFEHMKDKGCVPDTGTYNAMIFNSISIGDFEGCMKYYKSMLSNNSDPDVITYTTLISALLKARKVADALELFDEMLSRSLIPCTGTVTSFLEPLCSYGPPHAAMMIYKKARKVGCRISLSAYKLLLMRLSRFGKCGMLLNMWDEMQECGYSSDMEVYEHVINGLCNIGQLENAVLVMEESLRKGFCPSRLIYSKLNNKLLALNKVERAYKLYLKIKDARRDENARRYWRANGWHF
ncbi:putative pentatricopeptide repeat-containing protein At5g43820 isoform X1 [Quercus lobata]|uniref:Pentatricopeptide repeat-containing protein n=1 Tax=Quercus lobata TaxID=97700 RepID=A0A7N2KTN4_QUELO|nr:putative pentatricopeptide repeat-containing protein At5g43820 isoform X1 [Quercus lobata]XP_030950980.1 putative pentatricopeptide repeat-containing protein At5g43820 isoform X1 [Quercus lobata]XP_030950981.1 putative pentatricopeptide repeat-containing protein At5g43820 isoform X1 [Quercus lobata]XP_030950982.1 putative pentatricopeptide repeat-containing protein At5g43820 isoform X1 [Quercus lobata]